MAEPLTVLGLETSCDETAAAVVRLRADDGFDILSNVVLSQLDAHRPYGGVVPEIAARAHVAHLDRLVDEAVAAAGVTYAGLDGIAATAGPGLIGGVIVGLMTGKTLALAHGKPFVAVNHLEGHALSVMLEAPVAFPYLLLLISGGHTQLLIVEGVGRYHCLGTTVDDAVGEAFDKTAKLLGLGFPGGPQVEKAAVRGDASRFDLPLPMVGRPGCDFSFSGLKTAVRMAFEATGCDAGAAADLAAAFQRVAAAVLEDRCGNAMDAFRALYPALDKPAFVVAGGVAANQAVRGALTGLCAARGFSFTAPRPALCTDNGAMIACAGALRLKLGLVDGFEAAPRARWPLDSLAGG